MFLNCTLKVNVYCGKWGLIRSEKLKSHTKKLINTDKELVFQIFHNELMLFYNWVKRYKCYHLPRNILFSKWLLVWKPAYF